MQDEEGHRLLGYCDPESRILHIRDGLHPVTAALVLNHEWIHGILWESGVGNFLDENTTEAVCDALGAGLANRLK